MAGDAKQQERSVPETEPRLYDIIHGGLPYSFSPDPALTKLRLAQPRLNSIVRIGGRDYRQEDRGGANVLVDAEDPAEAAIKRSAVKRIAYMADNTMAGMAYGVASAARASPQTRDIAMLAGGAANTAMTGVAPLGARTPFRVSGPPPRPPQATEKRDPIQYGQANQEGQTSGGNGIITSNMINTGKRAKEKLNLPGLIDSRTQQKGHVMARGLGGVAKTPSQAMALFNRVNRRMGDFERAVMKRVRAGEVVNHFVKPLYEPGRPDPAWVVLSARGSRGDFTPQIIQNSPNLPRKNPPKPPRK